MDGGVVNRPRSGPWFEVWARRPCAKVKSGVVWYGVGRLEENSPCRRCASLYAAIGRALAAGALDVSVVRLTAHDSVWVVVSCYE